MARQDPIEILVTGFGPFPGVHSNLSGDLIRWIEDGRMRLPTDANVTTAVVPTSWRATADFVNQTMAELDPDIALHFGVSRRAPGFQVEQIARNAVSRAADCNGQAFAGPCLSEGGPPLLRPPVGAQQLVHELRYRGLPAATSRDAGRYLCNMLLYMSLEQAQVIEKTRITNFTHLPLRATRQLAKKDFLTGAEIILAHCMRVYRRTSSAAAG